MTNLDSIFKSRDINLRTKFRLVKAMVFPVVMTMIGPCKMSSRSLMFFGVHSKFLDVSFFRPNLFIEDNSRTEGGGETFHCQAAQEVLCHHNVPL